MRVVFTVLDALPARHVGPDHTPVLFDLAMRGGLARDGALAVMTSATYPNHAPFATGAPDGNRFGPSGTIIDINWSFRSNTTSTLRYSFASASVLTAYSHSAAV